MVENTNLIHKLCIKHIYSKQFVNHSQADSQQNVNQEDISPFGKRLREAFDFATNKEIADKLKVTKSALTNYMNGRVPAADALLEIKKLTNCSLDWLLTGEGEKFTTQIRDGDLLPSEFVIDYEKVAERIIEGLKEGGKKGTDRDIVEATEISYYIFEPFRKNGYYGQTIYQILALRTNLSINWIITGKGNKLISTTFDNSEQTAVLNLTDETAEALKDFILKVVDENQRPGTPTFTIGEKSSEKDKKVA